MSDLMTPEETLDLILAPNTSRAHQIRIITHVIHEHVRDKMKPDAALVQAALHKIMED